MTIVEALKALYEALGGDSTDLDGLNTKAAVLAQIAEIAENIDGGGSDGGSLPANFPAEAAENADKLIGFDENGEYAAIDSLSGGGLGQYLVTFTLADDGKDGLVVSSNRTYAQVAEAFESNILFASVEMGGSELGRVMLGGRYFVEMDNDEPLYRFDFAVNLGNPATISLDSEGVSVAFD